MVTTTLSPHDGGAARLVDEKTARRLAFKVASRRDVLLQSSPIHPWRCLTASRSRWCRRPRAMSRARVSHQRNRPSDALEDPKSWCMLRRSSHGAGNSVQLQQDNRLLALFSVFEVLNSLEWITNVPGTWRSEPSQPADERGRVPSAKNVSHVDLGQSVVFSDTHSLLCAPLEWQRISDAGAHPLHTGRRHRLRSYAGLAL
jgi:hypothetical protein